MNVVDEWHQIGDAPLDEMAAKVVTVWDYLDEEVDQSIGIMIQQTVLLFVSTFLT